MGLISEMQADLAEAFDDDLADLIVKITLKRKVKAGIYNPTTGLTEKTIQNFISRGFFDAMPSDKVDGEDVLATDELLLVIGNEIATDPRIDDQIFLDDGTWYLIKGVKNVVGGKTSPIIYEIQVRQNGR